MNIFLTQTFLAHTRWEEFMTWEDETGESILQKDTEGCLVCTSNALQHHYPVLCANLEKHPTIHGVNL